jgi:spore germination cell wall hydrolase CwlJ-like protein
MAVGYVILNRAESKPIKEVVLKDKQFSCYNSGVKLPDDGKAFLTSMHVAWRVLRGKDITGGAKFYHTKKVKPHWRNKVSYVGDFGDHKFYKPLVKLQARKVIKYGKAIARCFSRSPLNNYGS